MNKILSCADKILSCVDKIIRSPNKILSCADKMLSSASKIICYLDNLKSIKLAFPFQGSVICYVHVHVHVLYLILVSLEIIQSFWSNCVPFVLSVFTTIFWFCPVGFRLLGIKVPHMASLQTQFRSVPDMMLASFVAWKVHTTHVCFFAYVCTVKPVQESHL